jgi:hypothetical protein
MEKAQGLGNKRPGAGFPDIQDAGCANKERFASFSIGVNFQKPRAALEDSHKLFVVLRNIEVAVIAGKNDRRGHGREL